MGVVTPISPVREPSGRYFWLAEQKWGFGALAPIRNGFRFAAVLIQNLVCGSDNDEFVQKIDYQRSDKTLARAVRRRRDDGARRARERGDARGAL